MSASPRSCAADRAANPTSHRRGSGTSTANRQGFTIVEVVVAIMILTGGIAALAGATGQIVRQLTLADLQSERTVAFQRVVDEMKSLPYDDVVDGSQTHGAFDVSWTVTNEGGNAKLVVVTTVGPGVSPNSTTNDPQWSETFTFRVLRR
jgi:prepilin-type N-terminal cleavage/methylation domain-containing protein